MVKGTWCLVSVGVAARTLSLLSISLHFQWFFDCHQPCAGNKFNQKKLNSFIQQQQIALSFEMDKYEVLRIAGRGAYGTAYLARRKTDGREVILKQAAR